MFTYMLAAIFAIAGVALGAVNVWNNAIAINGGTFVLNDLTAIVAGLAILSALLSLALGSIAQHARVVAALAVATIIGCTFVPVGYTLNRVGGVADAKAGGAMAHNRQIERTRKQIASLGPKLDEQRMIAARECRGYVAGKSKAKRWPNCLTARGLIANYEADLAASNAALTRLGAYRVSDPAGRRLEALFGALMPAKRYQVAHPVVTAVTLELGVALLLTIAGIFATGGVSRRRVPTVIDATATEISPVVTALRSAGAASNRELARRLGWSETKTCRAVQTLVRDGTLRSEQHGRQKLIALVA